MQNERKHSSIIDEIVEDANQAYSAMSLLELLTEENVIAEFSHRRGLDPVRKRLQERIRSHIERKLV